MDIDNIERDLLMQEEAVSSGSVVFIVTIYGNHGTDYGPVFAHLVLRECAEAPAHLVIPNRRTAY